MDVLKWKLLTKFNPKVIPINIEKLISKKAVFVVNHSGGKDSQAMFIFLKRNIPSKQLIIIHADLPGADWPGTIEHIQNTTDGYYLEVVRARKTFFEMVERRGMWPSLEYRQCTSDLKRDQIDKAIRRYLKEKGLFQVVSCIGIRAEESSKRAKNKPFKVSSRNSKAGWKWYEWLPIHDWPVAKVFSEINSAGQTPHWAYNKGMTRLSCCFCIGASVNDLIISAKINRDLYKKYCSLERKINHALIMPCKTGKKFLPETTGINC